MCIRDRSWALKTLVFANVFIAESMSSWFGLKSTVRKRTKKKEKKSDDAEK